MLITYQHEFPHEIQALRLMNQFVQRFGSLSTLKIFPNGDPYESPCYISHAREILRFFRTQNYGFLSI